MKKQVFSFLLALVLVVMMIPLTVSAADTDVAKIGNVSYASLADAINAATDGQTVEVLKDCNFAGATISKNITVKAAEGLTAKPLITTAASIVPGANTNLTFEGLAFYSTKNVFSFGDGSGSSTLNLKNCDVESNGYYCVFIDKNGITLNIEGGKYRSNWGVVICGATMPKTDEERTKITVNINGAEMTQTANVGGMYAVISNGNGKSNIEINVENSTLFAQAPEGATGGACIKIGGNGGTNNITDKNVLNIRNSILKSNVQYGIYVARTLKTDITLENSEILLENPTAATAGSCVKVDGSTENVTLTVKGDNSKLNSKSQYCIYFNGSKNAVINLDGGKLIVVETGITSAWAVSTYNTPADAPATVNVNGSEIDTAKVSLSLDGSTKLNVTAGNIHEEKSILYTNGTQQTAKGHPFTGTQYAQYLKGTTKDSESTNVRFAMQVPTEGYAKYGYLVSVNNKILFFGLANGEKIRSTETTTLFSSIYANGEKIGSDVEGQSWLALGIDGVLKADFDTEIRIRPYAIDASGKIILGETYAFTVSNLLNR